MEVVLQCRDDAGQVVDPAGMGLEELIVAIRGGPTGPPGTTEQPMDPVDLLQQVTHVMAVLTAVQAAAICALNPGPEISSGAGFVPEEIAVALTVSRASAVRLDGRARTLRAHPRVWAALAAGHLDPTKATILGRALFDIPVADPDGIPRVAFEADYERILDQGIGYAAAHTARQLELYLRRLLAQLGADVAPARRREGLARRGVWVTHLGDGTAELSAVLASEDAERVYAAVRAIALADRDGAPDTCPGRDPEGACTCTGRPCPDRPAPLGQWMADALVDLVLGSPGHGESGRHASVSTEVQVVIPIDSLAGLSDRPGTLTGYGCIPAEVARRLAAGDARWRHVLVQRGTGAVLDVGTLSYRPPAGLERHVRQRDGTCRFPGCAVAAGECDLDHTVPFPVGSTSADNLHALCRRHHRLKHEGGWQVEALPDGGLRWTSPHGAVATTHPAQPYAASVA